MMLLTANSSNSTNSPYPRKEAEKTNRRRPRSIKDNLLIMELNSAKVIKIGASPTWREKKISKESRTQEKAR